MNLSWQTRSTQHTWIFSLDCFENCSAFASIDSALDMEEITEESYKKSAVGTGGCNEKDSPGGLRHRLKTASIPSEGKKARSRS